MVRLYQNCLSVFMFMGMPLVFRKLLGLAILTVIFALIVYRLIHKRKSFRRYQKRRVSGNLSFTCSRFEKVDSSLFFFV